MEWKLIDKILASSNSKIWESAKTEWKILEIYLDDSPQTCACGHNPIKEIIIIKNIYNNNKLTVGNHCINTIFSENYNKIFHALSRGIANEALVTQSHHDHIINDWEKDFMFNVWRKRKLTSKQHDKYNDINNRIIKFYTRRIHHA